MTRSRDDEVDANFDAFQAMLPSMLSTHRGQYALLRHRQLQGCYASLRAALEAARSLPDEWFSIQEVSDRPADLGLFSHADNTRFV